MNYYFNHITLYVFIYPSETKIVILELAIVVPLVTSKVYRLVILGDTVIYLFDTIGSPFTSGSSLMVAVPLVNSGVIEVELPLVIL